MDSIVNHYSVRQAGSVQGRSSLAPSKRASGARRPSSTRAGPTSGKRKSSVVPRNIPTTPASISEGDDSRQVKRAKTTDEVTSINASAESVEAKPQVVFVNDHAGAKRAGQVAAARRKSRSSVGRKSVGKAAMLGGAYLLFAIDPAADFWRPAV